MTIQYPNSIKIKFYYLMATYDKEIMSFEKYYVNKFDEYECSDN